MFVWCATYLSYVSLNRIVHISQNMKLGIAIVFTGIAIRFLWRQLSVGFQTKTENLSGIASCLWAGNGVLIATTLFIANRLAGINPDVQGLAKVNKIPLAQYLNVVIVTIPNVIIEELFCFFVFVIAYNVFPKEKGRIFFAAFASAFMFGFSHIFAWNITTAVVLFVTRFVVALVFASLADICPLILFHVMNNVIVASGMTQCAGVLKPVLVTLASIPMLMYLARPKEE